MKLIFVALQSEWKKFLEAYERKSELKYSNDKEMVLHYPDFNLLVYQTGIGPDLPLSFLEEIMDCYNITEIYNIGFCGIHHSSPDIGTVVIPETISAYGLNKGPYANNMNVSIINKIEGVIIPGLITFPFVVTGEKVSLPDEAIAIDMESFYLTEKLTEMGKKLTVIKIVSDYLTTESLGELIKIHLKHLRAKQKEIMDLIAGIDDK